MQLFSFLIWNADPQIVEIGFIQLRWYGLLFALGFIISQQILYYIHKKEGKPVQDVDELTVYMVIATIIGARLGHVFFYEPDKYLADPIEILMIQKGGLASHGAAVGILLALWIYSKYSITIKGLKITSKKISRPNQSYLQVLDRLVILVAMAGALIRLGNFANSEIEGQPTGSATGVFFARNVTESLVNEETPIQHVDYVKWDTVTAEPGFEPIKILAEFKGGYEEREVRGYLDITLKRFLVKNSYVNRYIHEEMGGPLNYTLVKDGDRFKAIINTHAVIRYPTQLIESAGYFLVFILLFLMWNRYKINLPEGRIFGYFMVILWGFRFVFEFFKENQVEFEDSLPLNMGQILSIPLVLIGVIVLIRSYTKRKTE